MIVKIACHAVSMLGIAKNSPKKQTCNKYRPTSSGDPARILAHYQQRRGFVANHSSPDGISGYVY